MARPLFDEIYVVGDSWLDSGLHYGLSSQLLAVAAAAGVDTDGLQPIPYPPYAQHYSNGPVLTEVTADLLGADLTSFAGGGAHALGTFPFGVIAGFVYPPEVIAAVAASPEGQAILWGTSVRDPEGQAILWGTSDEEAILWGTGATSPDAR